MRFDMPTLTYWVSRCESDSASYGFRAKTKKECEKMLADHNAIENGPFATKYGPVTKHTIQYKDSFDLMDMCLGEARGYEPY